MNPPVATPILTDQQKLYVKNRVRGLNMQQSAIAAGYANWDNVGSKVEESAAVQMELAAQRGQLAKKTGVTKEMVAAGLMAAAEMAQTMSDPVAMVTAWRELGKLLGHYAPEVKRLETAVNKNELMKALGDLSDEELLRLRGGRIIDGEVLGKSTAALPYLR